MGYKCIKCGNHLLKTNDLRVIMSKMVENQPEEFSLDIRINSDAKIEADSIGKIRQKLQDPYHQDHTVRLTKFAKLDGSKGDFNIQSLILNIPGTKYDDKAVEAKMSICCIVCDKCYRYSY